MAPILIDNRGLRKLGFIAVLITLFTFAGGFLLGYQQATVFYVAGSESGSLSLPMKNASVDGDIEQQEPEIVDAGEKIDVDQPEVYQPEIAMLAIDQTKVIKKADTKIKQHGLKQEKLTTQAAISSVDEKSAAVIESINASNLSKYETQVEKSGPAIDKTSGIAASIKVNNQAKQTKAAALITTDEANKIKFSIQVGIYGRLINAQNMKRKLQAQHLDAYVSDSGNKKNKFRYNVRFGYFVDKNSAITALEEYKNSQKGNGYLVNYSAENIIKLAGADNTEKTDNEPNSVTTPVDVIQGKVLQADILKAPNVLTKSQDKHW